VNINNGFPFEIKLPDSAHPQNLPGRQEYIRSLCGKYKSSSFSTARYFEQKRRDKDLEKETINFNWIR